MTQRSKLLALAATTAAVAALTAPATQAAPLSTLGGATPLVIGHRGASGYRPEHTLASYALAIQQGANYIEPDLVMTRDGHLIARHEPVLDGTTDVASKFGANRMSTRMLDGVSTTAYFADTFTLAEIKTLNAVQTRGRSVDYSRNTTPFDSNTTIPTLDEVISLAQAQSLATGRTIGIYPELKHSTYMSQQALANGFSATAFEDALVAKLHAAYGNSASAPVFIQSFETANLRYLNGQTNIRLVQLVDANDVNADGSLDLTAPYDRPYDITAAGGTTTFADLLTPVGLAAVAQYADGIGPWKPYLVKTTDNGGAIRTLLGSTGVIEAAHAAGLLVHTWTFRADAPGGQYGFASAMEEMAYYFGLGVDGVFTDQPDVGVAALAAALAAVPEPASWGLAALGLLAAGSVRRRRAG